MSQILQDAPPIKYYLSPKACLGILRRASERGKAPVSYTHLDVYKRQVKEAAQQAVISTINDNSDDVYHAVREGYAAGWYPDGTGRWDERDVYKRQELQYVEVISVTASSGYDANTGEVVDEKELPSTVTLLVTTEQAKVLEGRRRRFMWWRESLWAVLKSVFFRSRAQHRARRTPLA